MTFYHFFYSVLLPEVTITMTLYLFLCSSLSFRCMYDLKWVMNVNKLTRRLCPSPGLCAYLFKSQKMVIFFGNLWDELMTNIESENWRAWFGWIIMEDDKRWIDELSQDGKSDRKCAFFNGRINNYDNVKIDLCSVIFPYLILGWLGFLIFSFYFLGTKFIWHMDNKKCFYGVSFLDDFKWSKS